MPPCEGELVQVAENLIVEAGTQLREGLTVEDINKRCYNQPQQKVLFPHNDHQRHLSQAGQDRHKKHNHHHEHQHHLSQAGLLHRLATTIQLNETEGSGESGHCLHHKRNLKSGGR